MKMTRSILSLLIFLMFSTDTSAQNISSEHNYWAEYYPFVNKAEKFLIEDNLYDALKNYQVAFKNVENGFMKDYFNAAVCATYLSDATTTYHFLEKLATKGLSLDFVKDEVAFASIQKDSAWRGFELKYLELKRKKDEAINPALKETLQILVNRDTYYREKANFPLDSLALIDSENAVLLDTLISQFGFMGEDEIGVGQLGYPVIEFPFYQIIKRQYPENQTVNFSNQILKASRTGKISPHFAARLLAIINNDDLYFSRLVYKIQVDDELAFSHIPNAKKLNKWVYIETSAEDERPFNELRLKNGMETLADYREKVLFSLEESRFLLPYKALASVWYVRDAQTANDYLEGAIVAK